VNSTTTKQVYRIGVQGMDCRACEQLLLKHVQRIEGITTAYADAVDGTLTILADPETSAEKLAAAVVAAGFVPHPFDGRPALVPVTDLRATADVVGAAPPDAAPAPVAAAAPTDVVPPAPAVSVAPAAPAPAPEPVAATATASFAVGGMTCASCSAVIEKVLGKVDGVSSATVNLATERLAVTYDPAVIDTAGIAAKVKAAGYTAMELGVAATHAAAPAAAPGAGGSAGAAAPAATTGTAPAGGTASAAGGRVTLGLIGMTCSSCAGSLRRRSSEFRASLPPR